MSADRFRQKTDGDGRRGRASRPPSRHDRRTQAAHPALPIGCHLDASENQEKPLSITRTAGRAPVSCRGAGWSPLIVVQLHTKPISTRQPFDSEDRTSTPFARRTNSPGCQRLEGGQVWPPPDDPAGMVDGAPASRACWPFADAHAAAVASQHRVLGVGADGTMVELRSQPSGDAHRYGLGLINDCVGDSLIAARRCPARCVGPHSEMHGGSARGRNVGVRWQLGDHFEWALPGVSTHPPRNGEGDAR
jgi:hypothetical protein